MRTFENLCLDSDVAAREDLWREVVVDLSAMAPVTATL
jgi:hypothetical protein